MPAIRFWICGVTKPAPPSHPRRPGMSTDTAINTFIRLFEDKNGDSLFLTAEQNGVGIAIAGYATVRPTIREAVYAPRPSDSARAAGDALHLPSWQAAIDAAAKW